MKRIVFVGILVVLIVVAIGVFQLFSNLDALVASVIEKEGSKVTGTPVSVARVDISLGEGRGAVSGLRIGNPEGFAADAIFELDDVAIALDVSSITEDPIVLEEVRIQGPVIHAQFSDTGELNLDTLRKRLQNVGASETAGVQEGPTSTKKLRIRHFVFTGARVEVDASALGIDGRTIELRDIRLDDIGGSQGIPPDQVARRILSAVTKQTAEEVARSEVSRLIEAQLGESLSDKAKGLLQQIGK